MDNKVQAHRDAVARYAKSRKAFTIRLEPEEYASIVASAESSGMSIRAFILQAIREKMAKKQ